MSREIAKQLRAMVDQLDGTAPPAPVIRKPPSPLFGAVFLLR